MGASSLPRIRRILHPQTSSASAKCARISAIDHRSSVGRVLSRFLLRDLVSCRSFLGVAFWILRGFFPSTYPRMRLVYCCGVSFTDDEPPGRDWNLPVRGVPRIIHVSPIANTGRNGYPHSRQIHTFGLKLNLLPNSSRLDMPRKAATLTEESP